MVHVGASTEPKIAHHKSTMENPLLYREKNEVAGMGKNWYGSKYWEERGAGEERKSKGN